MTGYSTTGTWVIVSGPVLVGPYDGRSPAATDARLLRAAGADVRLQRLHSPADARRWAQRPAVDPTRARVPLMANEPTQEEPTEQAETEPAPDVEVKVEAPQPPDQDD